MSNLREQDLHDKTQGFHQGYEDAQSIPRDELQKIIFEDVLEGGAEEYVKRLMLKSKCVDTCSVLYKFFELQNIYLQCNQIENIELFFEGWFLGLKKFWKESKDSNVIKFRDKKVLKSS